MAYSVFLIASSFVLYTWIVYPLFLWVMWLLCSHARQPWSHANLPFVSIIIPVHNEEQTIAVKLSDCIELLYPRDRLEILVVSDGSTDRTEEIVRRFLACDSRIRWLQSDKRVGKSGAQNLAAGQARGNILFFTDANTAVTPGVLRTMIDDLADPTVGLVTATVQFGRPQDAVEKGQGVYWGYELFLRGLESDLGMLATGSGQALVIRKELFQPLPPWCGDDCIMPLDVRLQGYRVIQDREAVVFDAMPHSIEGELRARARMTERNWVGTLSRPVLLHPLRYPMTALGLVSHKLLRWLTSFFLAVVLLSNTLLALEGRAQVLLWVQVGFYLSALLGWQLMRSQRPAWLFAYPFSFCLANLGFFLGVVKALRNQRIVAY